MIRAAALLALLGLMACGADGAPVPLGDPKSPGAPTIGVTGTL